MHDEFNFERITSDLESGLLVSREENNQSFQSNITIFEKLNDYNDMFVSLLLDPISEALQHDRWAIQFTEKNPFNGSFWADIYVDKIPEDFDIIADLIKTLIPMQIYVTVWYKGNFGNFLKRKLLYPKNNIEENDLEDESSAA